MLPCPRCAGAEVKKDGTIGETQRYHCHSCRRTFVVRTGTPFASHRCPQAVIVLAVRWYCHFRLSAANVRDLLAERGVDVSARTVLHWVQKFAPLLARAGRFPCADCGPRGVRRERTGPARRLPRRGMRRQLRKVPGVQRRL